MMNLSLIGNLGADARVENNHGNPFVSFNVADRNQWTDAAGQVHEETTWISCTLNGDGGRLLPYLKKGTLVYVNGRPSTRVYSSERDRCMKAGINLFVRQVELVGGRQDEVPSRLFTPAGQMVDIYKAYFTDQEPFRNTILQDRSLNQYQVDQYGFVRSVTAATAPAAAAANATTQEVESATVPSDFPEGQAATSSDQSDAPFAEDNPEAQALAGAKNRK